MYRFIESMFYVFIIHSFSNWSIQILIFILRNEWTSLFIHLLQAIDSSTQSSIIHSKFYPIIVHEPTDYTAINFSIHTINVFYRHSSSGKNFLPRLHYSFIYWLIQLFVLFSLYKYIPSSFLFYTMNEWLKNDLMNQWIIKWIDKLMRNKIFFLFCLLFTQEWWSFDFENVQIVKNLYLVAIEIRFSKSRQCRLFCRNLTCIRMCNKRNKRKESTSSFARHRDGRLRTLEISLVIPGTHVNINPLNSNSNRDLEIGDSFHAIYIDWSTQSRC